MVYIYYYFAMGRRPLRIPDEDGSILAVDDGIASFDCRGSLSLPISVIDSGKVRHLVQVY